MSIDLSSVGMKKGQQYETIITTIDSEGKKMELQLVLFVKINIKLCVEYLKVVKHLTILS